MSNQENEAELNYLRKEGDRLRRERDLARKDRDDYQVLFENESSVKLKFLAETLSRDIKERFLGSLKNSLWAATLLIGIATAGGLWKLSDIVTARVDEKIKEKEQDVAEVRQQIIKSVVDFERQARSSLDAIDKLKAQVAKESEQATGEIRQAKARMLSLTVSSEGDKVTVSASTTEGSSSQVWFGNVTGGVAAVAGSQADAFGYDDPRTHSGAFSFRFQKALQDPAADSNQDGQVSVAEAAKMAGDALERDGFAQAPTVAGNVNDIALFCRSKSGCGPKKYQTVFAVVVGVNKYRDDQAMSLEGAVNDAKGFVTLLKPQERQTFAKANVEILTDERATIGAINEAIAALHGKATDKDLVLFFFSGHVASIGQDKASDKIVNKVIFPTDGQFEKGKYLKVKDVVKAMSESGAKSGLVIVDG